MCFMPVHTSLTLLEFGLQLSPVVVLARPQHLSEFVPHSPLLLSVSRPESLLFLVQECLYVIGNPGLVIGETVNGPGSSQNLI